jgi:ubiquitin-protein ligase
MAQVKVNRMLKNQIDELTLLAAKSDVSVRFILDETPFNEEVPNDLAELKERIIIGRIFPNSNIFKEGAFQIEIKLPSIYPLDPPKVRFLTPIYHPNVSKDGK